MWYVDIDGDDIGDPNIECGNNCSNATIWPYAESCAPDNTDPDDTCFGGVTKSYYIDSTFLNNQSQPYEFRRIKKEITC